MPWDDLREALSELGPSTSSPFEVAWAVEGASRRRAGRARLDRKRPPSGTCMRCQAACPGKWYCSVSCRMKAYRARLAAGYAPLPGMRRVLFQGGACRRCGVPCSGRLYCSASCRTSAWRAAHGVRRVRCPEPRPCKRCGSPVQPRVGAGRGGQPAYCSDGCRAEAHREQAREEWRRNGAERSAAKKPTGAGARGASAAKEA